MMDKTVPEAIHNNREFDLTIIGNGLQASLLLASAAGKGLKVAFIAENDCAENSSQSSFILVEPVFNCRLFKIPFRTQLIKSLKKSFAHLFIDSYSERYQKINWINWLILKLYQLLNIGKIEIHKKTDASQNPYFSYKSYKFSIIRMSMALFKKAVQLGAEIYSYQSLNSIEYIDNQKYKIKIRNKISNQNFNIISKSIINFNLNSIPINNKKTANKTSDFFYFTYPKENLMFQKNRILRTNNQYLKIILWFDLVYFEFTNKDKASLSLENTILFVNTHFNDIQIDKTKIQTFGIHKKLSNSENTDKTQLAFFVEGKQIEFKYKSVNQWFDYSNKICSQLIKLINKGIESESIIGKIVFQGSELPKTVDPLRIMEYADEKYDQAKQILKSPIYFKKLFYTYGSDIELITDKAYEYWNETKDSKKAWLKAEIWFSITHEFCISANDFIQHRSENWLLGNQINKEEIAQYFKELMH